MRKYIWMVVILLGFGTVLNYSQIDSKEITRLWPEIEPFHTEYLKVSDIHEIYFELCGNPEGKPVFVIHGGPGGSCSPYYRRFFNPDSLCYEIISYL